MSKSFAHFIPTNQGSAMQIALRLLIGSEDLLEILHYPPWEDYYELALSVDMDFCPQIGWRWTLFPADPGSSYEAELAGIRMNHGTDNHTLFDLVVEGATFEEIRNDLAKEGWVLVE